MKCKQSECRNRCKAVGMDRGANPYVANVSCLAVKNQNFRSALWTGHYLQMTLMDIPVCGQIGWEVHGDTDQTIRIEKGSAVVQFGSCKGHPEYEREVFVQDVIFVPAGTWHNVLNIGKTSLKVSSIYAPPHHPWGAVQEAAEEA